MWFLTRSAAFLVCWRVRCPSSLAALEIAACFPAVWVDMPTCLCADVLMSVLLSVLSFPDLVSVAQLGNLHRCPGAGSWLLAHFLPQALVRCPISTFYNVLLFFFLFIFSLYFSFSSFYQRIFTSFLFFIYAIILLFSLILFVICCFIISVFSLANWILASALPLTLILHPLFWVFKVNLLTCYAQLLGFLIEYQINKFPSRFFILHPNGCVLLCIYVCKGECVCRGARVSRGSIIRE